MPKLILTSELRDAILYLAVQPDIRSISCPFDDFDLWKGLFKAQVNRANRLNLPPQKALCLMGPSSGIPGITIVRCGREVDHDLSPIPPDSMGRFAPHCWGGEVHIPYDGYCGGDLFILPNWHNVYPEALSGPDPKFHWLVRKECNFLLTGRDLGEFDCATRLELVRGWWLYRNPSPFPDCNPFHHKFYMLDHP